MANENKEFIISEFLRGLIDTERYVWGGEDPRPESERWNELGFSHVYSLMIENDLMLDFIASDEFKDALLSGKTNIGELAFGMLELARYGEPKKSKGPTTLLACIIAANHMHDTKDNEIRVFLNQMIDVFRTQHTGLAKDVSVDLSPMLEAMQRVPSKKLAPVFEDLHKSGVGIFTIGKTTTSGKDYRRQFTRFFTPRPAVSPSQYSTETEVVFDTSSRMPKQDGATTQTKQAGRDRFFAGQKTAQEQTQISFEQACKDANLQRLRVIITQDPLAATDMQSIANAICSYCKENPKKGLDEPFAVIDAITNRDALGQLLDYIDQAASQTHIGTNERTELMTRVNQALRDFPSPM